MRTIARRLKNIVFDVLDPNRKKREELQFWQNELVKYEDWYLGKLPMLYKTPSPSEEDKFFSSDLREASVLTWHRLHQEPKYLRDLGLERETFAGKRILDVGSGPIPSATCFSDCEIYCLDPLLPQYVAAGFPFECYKNVHFVPAHSENMTLGNSLFDAVIAVNSLDHVDSIRQTVSEIRRVLKPGGDLRFHVHYHNATICEPLELNDKKMTQLFSWCPNFVKLTKHSDSFSSSLPVGEEFTLWGTS